MNLTLATMATLDELINQNTVVGSRYNAQANGEVDTENFQSRNVFGNHALP